MRFRWIDVDDPRSESDLVGQGPWLVAADDSPPRPALANLSAALCCELAETSPDSAGVLDFAERYGWLGVHAPNTPHVPANGKWTTRARAVRGESFVAWRGAIAHVRQALVLLDPSAFNAHRTVRWSANRRERRRRPEPIHTRSSDAVVDVRDGRTRRRYTIFARDPQRDDALVIRCAARSVVNLALTKHAAIPSLQLDGDGVLHLDHEPHTLLAALWIQIARSAEGKHAHRRCEGCGRWFAVGPDLTGTAGARADARYCTRNSGCRVRAFRRRAASGKRRAKGKARNP